MQMKRLILKNIGPISEVELALDKKLIILKGDVQQGKTTILKSIGWLLGSKYPSDLLKTGEKTGFIQLEYDDVIVRKDFYRKDGVTKNKKVYFKNGWDDAVAKPSEELKKILSPFTTDQDYFINMNEPEKRRFLLELFNVDTKEIDAKIKEVTESMTVNKKVLSALPVVEASGETLDIKVLEKQRDALCDANTKIMEQHYTEKAKRQRDALDSSTALTAAEDRIAEVKLQRERLAAEEAALAETIDKGLTVYEEMPEPVTASTEELTNLIIEASKQSDNAAAIAKRAGIEEEIRQLAETKRGLVKEKTTSLSGVNDTHGVEGLVFNEDGTISYEGTDSGYLSTSQVMRLSSALSAKFPEAIAIETVDRAESLGDSILTLVTKATLENRTYLASIVGESIAKNSDEVGVFLVKGGTII